MLTPDLAISGIVSVSIITNVIYRSADFKNYAPSFKNTVVVDMMNCCVCVLSCANLLVHIGQIYCLWTNTMRLPPLARDDT